MKEKLFSITKEDCRWDYYRGSGARGQKRNKTENCCRCTHIASGAVGRSEEGRSKEQNKKRAFKKMAESKEFNLWVKREVSNITGQEAQIQKEIDKQMRKVRVEVKSEEGKWVKK